ncbi:MAG: hypothetical protein A4E69_02143 [Syntrophus sp. PtaB.Bin138]|nr:MAG: hypothetical protein A4E69_02143 [Syntrophus sp. PtaB.Bin138]
MQSATMPGSAISGFAVYFQKRRGKEMNTAHGEIKDKLTIAVIGPGCSYCKKLYQRVWEVAAGQGMAADIVHVTDLKTVLRYIPFTPVLKVNGRIVHRGKRLPDKGKILELLERADNSNRKESRKGDKQKWH